MDIIDMIKESFNYALLDKKQLLIFSIPLIIGSMLNYFATLSNNIIFMLLAVLVIFISAFFYAGLTLNIIRQTINMNNELPQLDIQKFLLDGLKFIIVEFVLVGITAMIIGFLIFYMQMHIELAFIIMILLVIFVILTIYLSIINVIASGVLAQTNSISEALSFTNLKQTADKIGKAKIFSALLLSGILVNILSMIVSLIAIPIVNSIVFGVVSTFIAIFNARLYALIYNERNQRSAAMSNQITGNNQMIGDNNPQNDNASTSQSTNSTDEEVSKESFENYIEESEKDDSVTADSIKTCSKCGHSNPGFVRECLNCGELF